MLTEGQLTTPLAGKAKKARPKRDSNQQKLQSYADLTPGDLVVHQHHGIGRYRGHGEDAGGRGGEGLCEDRLRRHRRALCPRHPAGPGEQVHRRGRGRQRDQEALQLGGTDWEKAKSRAKKAVQDLAKGLIQLYAQRQRQPGFAFSPDSPWQREFEEEFEYTETEDQLRCIEEIKRDMERPVPMDRLLCGDVGYGKTEVAFRAMMKCVLDGKQAAILVPTTVLARQHYLTALSRFAKYPVTSTWSPASAPPPR